MTAKTPLRLWWKARRRSSQLRPEIKTVYDERVGHVFQRRYWVRPPEAETTERRNELADAALHYTGAQAQYDAYDNGYSLIKKDWETTPIRISFDDWERHVKSAHEKLRGVFGSDRVAVFVPIGQVPELEVAAEATSGETTENLPLFALMYGIDADLTDHIVKDLELPPFYYFAIGSAVNGEEHLFAHIKESWDIQRDIWNRVVLDFETKTVPSQIIDPSSRTPIYFDDYLKRHLSGFEEAYFRGLRSAVRKFKEGLESRMERASDKTLHRIFEVDFGAFEDDDIRQMREVLGGFADWVKEHSGAFKVWLSFLVPAGERNIATLAYYAFAKTALDYITLMTSKEAQEVSDANTVLSVLQKRFDYWVDEGKKALGLEKVAAPTETLLKVLKKTLNRFWVMVFGWGHIDEPKISVRMLATPPLWTHLVFSDIRERFKEVAEALINEPLREGFEKFPQDRKFLKALYMLTNFYSAISAIGAKALSERKVLKEPDYDDETLRSHAKRAIGKFHNELSQVVRAVTKARDMLKGKGDKEVGVKDYAAVVIGFSPADFYSLTMDGTCFGNSNRHHPFILGMLPNTYTLRVFVGGKWGEGGKGRAWGVIDPDKKVMYVSNRYGNINQPTLMKISALVASSLFGVPPDKLEIKEDAKDEFDAVISKACEEAGLSETPYLNRDAFKVSVKKG
jgi:hypothetical protein